MKQNNRGNFLTVYLIILVIVIATILLIIWQEVKMKTYKYEIAQLQKKRSRLENKKKRLDIKKVELENPDRIKKIAINKLGLTEPKNSKVIIIEMN